MKWADFKKYKTLSDYPYEMNFWNGDDKFTLKPNVHTDASGVVTSNPHLLKKNSPGRLKKTSFGWLIGEICGYRALEIVPIKRITSVTTPTKMKIKRDLNRNKNSYTGEHYYSVPEWMWSYLRANAPFFHAEMQTVIGSRLLVVTPKVNFIT